MEVHPSDAHPSTLGYGPSEQAANRHRPMPANMATTNNIMNFEVFVVQGHWEFKNIHFEPDNCMKIIYWLIFNSILCNKCLAAIRMFVFVFELFGLIGSRGGNNREDVKIIYWFLFNSILCNKWLAAVEMFSFLFFDVLGPNESRGSILRVL